MAIYQVVRLRAAYDGVTQVIHAVQGDTGRRLRLVIEDYTLTAQMAAVCWFKRPNGTYYSKSGTVNSADGYVDVSLTASGGPFTQVGTVHAQLVITDSYVVSTYYFDIIVEESMAGTSSVEDISWKTQLQSDLEAAVTTKLDFGTAQALSNSQRRTVQENIGMKYFSVPASSTLTLTLAENTRILMAAQAAGSTHTHAVYLLNRGAGAPYIYKVGGEDSLLTTAGSADGTIVFTSTDDYRIDMLAIVYYGGVS